ncbi:MAG: hypothetical protein IJZ84_02290 [Lachnospiraceae bacterium]|nr:hypothetical protein [Lachnospiraceae bacterium]
MSIYINNENRENLLEKITQIDLTTKVPAEETERQYYYMAKARMHVQALTEELGRVPTCCVTTFGCQMNVEPVTA